MPNITEIKKDIAKLEAALAVEMSKQLKVEAGFVDGGYLSLQRADGVCSLAVHTNAGSLAARLDVENARRLAIGILANLPKVKRKFITNGMEREFWVRPTASSSYVDIVIEGDDGEVTADPHMDEAVEFAIAVIQTVASSKLR